MAKGGRKPGEDKCAAHNRSVLTELPENPTLEQVDAAFANLKGPFAKNNERGKVTRRLDQMRRMIEQRVAQAQQAEERPVDEGVDGVEEKEEVGDVGNIGVGLMKPIPSRDEYGPSDYTGVEGKTLNVFNNLSNREVANGFFESIEIWHHGMFRLRRRDAKAFELEELGDAKKKISLEDGEYAYFKLHGREPVTPGAGYLTFTAYCYRGGEKIYDNPLAFHINNHFEFRRGWADAAFV